MKVQILLQSKKVTLIILIRNDEGLECCLQRRMTFDQVKFMHARHFEESSFVFALESTYSWASLLCIHGWKLMMWLH